MSTLDLLPWRTFMRPLPDTEPERAAARAVRLVGWLITVAVGVAAGIAIVGGLLLSTVVSLMFGGDGISLMAALFQSLPFVAVAVVVAGILVLPCCAIYASLAGGAFVPRGMAIVGGGAMLVVALGGPTLLALSVFRLYSFVGIVAGALLTLAAPFIGRVGWTLLREGIDDAP